MLDIVLPLTVSLPYGIIMDLEQPSYSGGCCVPPPEFDLPPPPDPSLIFDLSENEQLDFDKWFLQESCSGEFGGSPIFVGDSGSDTTRNLFPLHQYFLYIVAIVGAVLLIGILMALFLLSLQRRGKCFWFIPSSNSSKESHSGVSSGTSNHKLTSRSNKQLSIGNTQSTQWTLDTMATNSYQRPTLHQAHNPNVGVIMYGGGSTRDVSKPNRTSNRANPAHSSCRTLPQHLVETPCWSAADDPNLRRTPLQAPPSPNNSSRIYEEIAYRQCMQQHYDSYPVHSDEDYYGSTPRKHRLPPPRVRPPPPPAPCGRPLDLHESPCSTSGGESTSLDQELDHIQITPSPKRRYPPSYLSAVGRGQTLPGNDVYNQPNEPDEISTSPENSSGTRDDQDCTSASGGRESGYGTQGRYKNQTNNTFSPHLHRGSRRKGQEGVPPPSPRTLPNRQGPQTMWVVNKRGTRDPPQLSATTTPVHAMTYV